MCRRHIVFFGLGKLLRMRDALALCRVGFPRSSATAMWTYKNQNEAPHVSSECSSLAVVVTCRWDNPFNSALSHHFVSDAAYPA
jgi:hypothetical protein